MVFSTQRLCSEGATESKGSICWLAVVKGMKGRVKGAYGPTSLRL
jgi:hypothetical protein